MKDNDYKLWLDYHYGLINRQLTKEEESEIRACEFAMHFLIPTEMLLKECNYDRLKKIVLSNDSKMINKLSTLFQVPTEVMIIKIRELIREKQEKDKPKIVEKVKSLFNR